jgi:hypothetical protein
MIIIFQIIKIGCGEMKPLIVIAWVDHDDRKYCLIFLCFLEFQVSWKCKSLSWKHKEKLFLDYYACDTNVQKIYLMGMTDICSMQCCHHGSYEDACNSQRRARNMNRISNEETFTIKICRITIETLEQ